MAENISREEMIQIVKQLATPIDLDQLIEKGVLVKHGAWYEVRDWEQLPSNANRQVQEVKQTPNGKFLVKFHGGTKRAQQLYKKLTGKSLDQE